MTRVTLNQPLTLPCGVTIKNRLAKSAMSEALGTTDNRVTEALPSLYGRWAEGGIGLLITGNVMVDRRALGEPNNVALEDARDAALLKRWAQAGTRQNTQLWVQLNHPGRQAPKGLNAENVAPSAVPFNPALQAFFPAPRALSDAEINDIIERFATAARLVKEAGFSGVQIHGAHGYLVSQFLSPLTNQREDDWGGSAEKRRHFVLQVYRAIRRQVGSDFPVGIKLNSADFQRGGFTEDESLAVIQALEAEGIDLIELSGGTYEAPAMSDNKRHKESTLAREAYFLTFAETIRSQVKVPLMVTGGFRTHQGMSESLAGGALDLVGMARGLAVEPDLPKRLLAGLDPLHAVKPITTGIKAVDRMALMEVVWYSRQLKRLARGVEAKPQESGLWAFLANLVHNGVGTWKTRRLRA
ncbi:NADH:flavin oxidoreductase/NADH oxidase family protein [Atopomonas sediminilitoris]|uniref:NADH:flavin oxidoreductase/NADH oxidase family protein n=1 Tax=Atopomonas sediminilitoris TaxID=2919919 RepID=UPI001F4E8505|nr:NADH:flavin oxidoreductase/NADH oxidase family protein [Atopomonas sediminilitoris]MCJ8168259.1 NADH:flavin oxidoreductase/NADH oxidase family protein [Atopomonas sediminilitoris]